MRCRSVAALVIALLVAMAGCQRGAERREGTLSMTDPGGDALNAPPELDLVGASVDVAGRSVVLTWSLHAAPSPTPEPGTTLTWSMVLIDDERARSVFVRRTATQMVAGVDFAGPKDRDQSELPGPELDGASVRLTTDLATLRWSGDAARWSARTTLLDEAAGTESRVVDEIEERQFGPIAHVSEQAAPVAEVPQIDMRVLERWDQSELLVPTQLPAGWSLLDAVLLKSGEKDYRPLGSCDRIVLSYGIPPRDVRVELFQVHPRCLASAASFVNVVDDLPRREVSLPQTTGWVLTDIPQGIGLVVAQLAGDRVGLLASTTHASAEEVATLLGGLAPFPA